RKDGKEASPKKNRTGYETQTTELSKMLTLQTLGKNFRRKIDKRRIKQRMQKFYNRYWRKRD
ncbi:hypothetical protein ABG824_12470, partial [Phocaeicola vulgatus]